MRIAFVCTANMVRSPLAEALCRRLLGERGIEGIEVVSAGLHAIPGASAAPGALRAAASAGLDLGRHRSRRFDPSGFGPSDLILVMEELHRRQILAERKVDPDTVRLVGEFAPTAGREIDDPMGGPDVAYERCVARLGQCLEAFVTWLEEERISRN